MAPPPRISANLRVLRGKSLAQHTNHPSQLRGLRCGRGKRCCPRILEHLIADRHPAWLPGHQRYTITGPTPAGVFDHRVQVRKRRCGVHRPAMQLGHDGCDHSTKWRRAPLDAGHGPPDATIESGLCRSGEKHRIVVLILVAVTGHWTVGREIVGSSEAADTVL
jgi:hypothetical protein